MSYTIIVNTCDRFEDCWGPFFKLFKKYWSQNRNKIILTTYAKNFNFSCLSIDCLRASDQYSEEPSWSDNLLFTLENKVDTDIVLFMLDDFFICDYVDDATINKCIEIMKRNNVSNITLTNHDTKRVYHKTENPLLSEIDKKSPYRITTSPALWKTASLKKYLRKNENIWMFEAFGTRRSYKSNDSFFRVNEDAICAGYKEVIPYFQGVDDTGIVKGKWQKGIEKVFDDAEIKIDFQKRGYYKKLPGIVNKYYLLKNLIKKPKLLYHGILGK